MVLEETVEAYLAEWIASLPPKDASTEWYSERMKQPYAMLESKAKFWNLVTPKANELLSTSADLLLKKVSEQRRIRRETARICLLEAQEIQIERAVKRGRLSEHAIVAEAIRQIKAFPRADGSYVVPVCFAPSAKKTRFRIGPAEILSRAEFEAQYGTALSKPASDEDWFGLRAVEEWKSYSERYDHFVVVEVKGHETEMAWRTARSVAEYVLNLFRIKFGFYHMDDVRIGNGFIWETSQAKVYFDNSGEANFSLSSGPWASHLDDGWTEHFDDDFGSEASLLASLASWMASGNDADSPVLERLCYANALISEAFSEPHEHIRLVRLIAALEALAALPREQKSENLAWRCAFAGGWTDFASAAKIVDDVRTAYGVRNAIVHGEAPAVGFHAELSRLGA